MGRLLLEHRPVAPRAALGLAPNCERRGKPARFHFSFKKTPKPSFFSFVRCPQRRGGEEERGDNLTPSVSTARPWLREHDLPFSPSTIPALPEAPASPGRRGGRSRDLLERHKPNVPLFPRHGLCLVCSSKILSRRRGENRDLHGSGHTWQAPAVPAAPPAPDTSNQLVAGVDTRTNQ